MWGGLNIIGDALKNIESQLDAAVAGSGPPENRAVEVANVRSSPHSDDHAFLSSSSSEPSNEAAVSPPPLSLSKSRGGSMSNLVQKLPIADKHDSCAPIKAPSPGPSAPVASPTKSATFSSPSAVVHPESRVSAQPSSTTSPSPITAEAVSSSTTNNIIAKVETLEKSNNALKAKCRALQKEHDAEIIALTQTHQQFVQEAAAFHADELQAQREKFEDYKIRQKEQSDTKLAELEAVNARLSEKVAHHAAQLARKQDRCMAPNERVQELVDQLAVATSKCEAMETAFEKDGDKPERNLAQELQDLKQAHSLLQNHSTHLAAKCELEKSQLQQQATESIEDLEAKVSGLSQELKTANLEVLAANEKLVVLENEKIELVRSEQVLRQTLIEREKTVEKLSGLCAEGAQTQNVAAAQVEELAMTIKMREQELDAAQQQLSRLSDENFQLVASSASGQIKTLQAEVDSLKMQVGSLGQINQDFESKLLAYTTEGQNLSRKQSEMEKVVRKSRAELKEKDGEIAKLKESRDQLSKVVADTQELLRKHESESNNSNKSVITLQTVNTNLQDKIYKLEGEVTSRMEELTTQKRALEASWNEVTECKRAINDLRVEKEDLVARLGQGTDQVLANEGVKRDAEQREAILRATNEQLQDQLARYSEEASVRDERNRNEIVELRQRWQDAVRARESLSSELISSTTPLLRQITQSQEALRAKTVKFQELEILYAEKNLALESQVKELTKAKDALAQELEDVSSKQSALVHRSQSLIQAVATLEQQCEAMKTAEVQLREQVERKEELYREEVRKSGDLVAEVKELQFKLAQDAHELAVVSEKLKLKELICAEMQAEIDKLKEQGQGQGSGSKFGAGAGSVGSNNREASVYAKLRSEQRAEEELILHSDAPQDSRPGTGGNGVGRGGEVAMPDSLPSKFEFVRFVSFWFCLVLSHCSCVCLFVADGSLSFAAAERNLIQSQRTSNSERAYVRQIQQLEAAHTALLEELSYVSARNAELEPKYQQSQTQYAAVSRQYKVLQSQNDLVLSMLGEKSEELDAALQDLKDVKELYRSQLDAALNQLTLRDAPQPSQHVPELIE